MLLVGRRVRKEIARLPVDVAERIWNEVEKLANDPRPSGCVKLQGIDAWRIRIGDYRVVYEISDSVVTVTVVRVRHRSDVYD